MILYIFFHLEASYSYIPSFLLESGNSLSHFPREKHAKKDQGIEELQTDGGSVQLWQRWAWTLPSRDSKRD